MKKQSTNAARYALTLEITAAHLAVEAARQKSSRHSEQVNLVAAQIAELDSEIPLLEKGLADHEAAMTFAEDSEIAAMEKTAMRLSTVIEMKARVLNRSRAKLKALEDMAPSVDDEVVTAGGSLRLEVGIWMQGVVQELSEELSEALKPVIGILAKARAIGGSELSDFLASVSVPDPVDCKLVPAASGAYNIGSNLLDLPADADQQAAANELHSQIAPVRRAATEACGHAAYIPLARRPKPYVIKGNRGPDGVNLTTGPEVPSTAGHFSVGNANGAFA